ncbi:hypothetical protein [Paenibacillus typhae]|uniref:hypothetical protein n=1 Tax=Paenibacillus typhae TaxID=1174501 RepID=UPI0039EE8FDF
MSWLLSDPADGEMEGAAAGATEVSGAAGCGEGDFAGTDPPPAAVAGEEEAAGVCDGGGPSAALLPVLQPVSSIKVTAVIIEVYRPILII